MADDAQDAGDDPCGTTMPGMQYADAGYASILPSEKRCSSIMRSLSSHARKLAPVMVLLSTQLQPPGHLPQLLPQLQLQPQLQPQLQLARGACSCSVKAVNDELRCPQHRSPSSETRYSRRIRLRACIKPPPALVPYKPLPLPPQVVSSVVLCAGRLVVLSVQGDDL